jgi:hypothetical protein
MDRIEEERRRHLCHWATFMIMHLEGHEVAQPRYELRPALERLRGLIDEELERLSPRLDRPLRAG